MGLEFGEQGQDHVNRSVKRMPFNSMRRRILQARGRGVAARVGFRQLHECEPRGAHRQYRDGERCRSRIVRRPSRRADPLIRLRLLNASNARIFGCPSKVTRLRWWRWMATARPIPGPRVVLGPGMRADIMLDCVGAPGSRHRIVDDFYQGRAYRLLDLLYSNEKPLQIGRGSFAPRRADAHARAGARTC